MNGAVDVAHVVDSAQLWYGALPVASQEQGGRHGHGGADGDWRRRHSDLEVGHAVGGAISVACRDLLDCWFVLEDIQSAIDVEVSLPRRQLLPEQAPLLTPWEYVVRRARRTIQCISTPHAGS